MGRKNRRNLPRSNKAGKAKQKIDAEFKCWYCKTVFVRQVPAIGKHPYYAYCNRECEKADMSDFHSKAVRLQAKLFSKAKRLHRQSSSDENQEKRDRT